MFLHFLHLFIIFVSFCPSFVCFIWYFPFFLSFFQSYLFRFLFSGAQNLFVVGLNCFTISESNSVKKNHLFQPSWGYPFFRFFIFHFLFLENCVSSLFFFLNICRFWHLYQGLTKDVSSVAGVPWRCGVLTTQGGTAGIGLGRLFGREHPSTPQSGLEAPRLLKTEPPQIRLLLLLLFLSRVIGQSMRMSTTGKHNSTDELPEKLGTSN